MRDPDPAATLRAIYDDHVHNPARDFGDIGVARVLRSPTARAMLLPDGLEKGGGSGIRTRDGA